MSLYIYYSMTISHINYYINNIVGKRQNVMTTCQKTLKC